MLGRKITIKDKDVKAVNKFLEDYFKKSNISIESSVQQIADFLYGYFLKKGASKRMSEVLKQLILTKPRHKITYKAVHLVQERYEKEFEGFFSLINAQPNQKGLAKEVYFKIIVCSSTIPKRIQLLYEIFGKAGLGYKLAICYCADVFSLGLNTISARKLLIKYFQNLYELYPGKFRKFSNYIIEDIGIYGHPSIDWKSILDDSFIEYLNNPRNYPSKVARNNGVIQITWNEVKFHDGYALVLHPKHKDHRPFRIDNPSSKEEYNNTPETLLKKLIPIIVVSKNGTIIEIVNLPQVNACIEILANPTEIPSLKKKIRQTISIEEKDRNEVERIIKDKDSKYLEYLCSNHISDYSIYCSTENRVNNTSQSSLEIGFIFTLANSENEIVTIYENTQSDRSTIVFEIEKDSYDDAISMIHQYFASPEVNKRRQLQTIDVDFSPSGIISYTRLNHTNFEDWCSRIKDFIDDVRSEELNTE